MLREILIPRRVEKQIAGLPRKRAARIFDELEGFSKNPDFLEYNVRTIAGSANLVPRYRMRSGSYRIIFSLMHDRFVVEAVTKKKDAEDD